MLRASFPFGRLPGDLARLSDRFSNLKVRRMFSLLDLLEPFLSLFNTLCHQSIKITKFGLKSLAVPLLLELILSLEILKNWQQLF